MHSVCFSPRVLGIELRSLYLCSNHLLTEPSPLFTCVSLSISAGLCKMDGGYPLTSSSSAMLHRNAALVFLRGGRVAYDQGRASSGEHDGLLGKAQGQRKTHMLKHHTDLKG